MCPSCVRIGSTVVWSTSVGRFCRREWLRAEHASCCLWWGKLVNMFERRISPSRRCICILSARNSAHRNSPGSSLTWTPRSSPTPLRRLDTRTRRPGVMARKHKQRGASYVTSQQGAGERPDVCGGLNVEQDSCKLFTQIRHPRGGGCARMPLQTNMTS